MAKIQRTKLSKERIRSAWIFLTPMFICLAVVAIYPLITTINYSFTDARLGDLYNYNYVGWFLPYISEIARILKPTGSFILNINDKSMDGFRHPFIFELIYAIHNIEDYCKIKNTEALDMRIKQFFDQFKRRRDKMNAEDKRETPGEFRVQYTEEELKDFFYNELRDKYIAFAKTKYPEAVGI